MLRLIKAMNFIDKEYGTQAKIPILPGVLDNPLDVLLATSNGTELDKLSLHLASNNPRQRRLARTRWPPKDEAYGLLLGDNLAQNLGIIQQVRLADHGIERLWAQPLGQRLA